MSEQRAEAIAARQRAEDKQWRQSEAERQERQHAAPLANQRAIEEMKAANQLERVNATQAGQNYRATIKSSSSGGGSSKAGKPILTASGETIYVPQTYLDDNDYIAEMYAALPRHLKEQAFEEYNLGKYTDKKQLSNAQMNDIVSQYRSHPDAIGVEKVLRRLAGMKPTADSDNVPPSRRAANNDNVPPSRR